MNSREKDHTAKYLKLLGVPALPPLTSPFDPGYDPGTLESHLAQSSHLFSVLKISMACWMVARESATREKIAAAKRYKVPTVTGGGQFEIGKKHTGPFAESTVEELIDQGRRWLDSGALQLVVEARESARGVGLFDQAGNFNPRLADRFASAFGLHHVMFEAPNKPSQFALLNHFGREVHLCNVRLEEVLRVEIYRRGLHSDAFEQEKLRPAPRVRSAAAG